MKRNLLFVAVASAAFAFAGNALACDDANSAEMKPEDAIVKQDTKVAVTPAKAKKSQQASRAQSGQVAKPSQEAPKPAST